MTLRITRLTQSNTIQYNTIQYKYNESIVSSHLIWDIHKYIHEN